MKEKCLIRIPSLVSPATSVINKICVHLPEGLTTEMPYFAQKGYVKKLAKIFENSSGRATFTDGSVKPEDSSPTTNSPKRPHPPPTELSDGVTGNQNHFACGEAINVEEDSCSTTHNNEESKSKPKKTKVYQHLKTYPVFCSSIKVVGWFPSARIAQYALNKVAYSKFFEPYTVAVDVYFDSRLTELDKAAPGIKRVQMRDIRIFVLDTPVTKITKTAAGYVIAVNKLTHNMIINPSKKRVHRLHDIRAQHIPGVDNQPIIRTYLMVKIKQINCRLSKDADHPVLFCEEYVPSEDPLYTEHAGLDDVRAGTAVSTTSVGSDDISKELVRTFELLKLAMLGSRPGEVKTRLQNPKSKPNQTIRYVAAAFQQSKENRGGGKIVVVVASLDTIRSLASTGYQKITAHWVLKFFPNSTPPTKKQHAFTRQ